MPTTSPETIEQQKKLEQDVMDLLDRQTGATIEELVIAINTWVDQGQKIDAHYAVVVLNVVSETCLGAPQKSLAVCSGCRRKLALRRCAACRTRYCSRECQVEDWPSHKGSCASQK